MKGPVKFCLVVALVAFPMTVRAFGADGHMIVGYVADKYLCAATRRAIKPLMGGYSLGDIGTWADQIRSDPDWYHASSWHYLNVGDRQSIANRRRPPQGDVLTALDKFQRQLQDKTLDTQTRAQALRFVVHFVADVHQPLHVGRSKDQGGNRIDVRVGGYSTNLHVLWDSYLILQAGLEPLAYAHQITPLANGKVEAWQASTPLGWAVESQNLRPKIYAYGQLAGNGYLELSSSYVSASKNIVELRMVKAGIRLAGLLNAIDCGGPLK
ncbi:uncharacterized protein METZ01_LOCUS235851 [marine metagenome]|uniref:S1/P1 Nuclease n=1 Tax=marine metagenome TaxID=408172 RepID=A0A382H7V0_9ZZZZ